MQTGMGKTQAILLLLLLLLVLSLNARKNHLFLLFLEISEAHSLRGFCWLCYVHVQSDNYTCISFAIFYSFYLWVFCSSGGRVMDARYEVQRSPVWGNQVVNHGLRLLWHFLHLLVGLWYLGVGIVDGVESYLISFGILNRYKSFDVSKLNYLAIVMESEDACQISEVVRLLQWLKAIGVKHLCLYDVEGILKRSKESILQKLNNAVLFEDIEEKNDLQQDKKHITLEFTSISDGKEAVAKAANLLYSKYLKLAKTGEEREGLMYTEAHLDDALRAIGCRGPEPDLLLVYGPVRCHLGFPAWRMKYTEIVHMGPLKSMRYGSLVKAISKFTRVRQNFGK